MSWLLFVDTSHHTDYVLVLLMTCFVAALTLYTALAVGLGAATAGVTILLVALIAATGYARFLWKLDERRKTGPEAFKIRPSR